MHKQGRRLAYVLYLVDLFSESVTTSYNEFAARLTYERKLFSMVLSSELRQNGKYPQSFFGAFFFREVRASNACMLQHLVSVPDQKADTSEVANCKINFLNISG